MNLHLKKKNNLQVVLKNIELKFLFLFFVMMPFTALFSQKNDSIKIVPNPDTAAVTKPKHNPKEATRRSFILPGWGQAYNKQYWKIPIVYGALSIPTITFFYNNTYYKEAKFAYQARFKAMQTGATKLDSLDYFSLESKYQKADINAIQSLRNSARRDRDYSIFWFAILWLVNVADATVFGHLKDFDVSNNLSMNVHPEFNVATKTPVLSFVFKLKDKKKKESFLAK